MIAKDLQKLKKNKLQLAVDHTKYSPWSYEISEFFLECGPSVRRSFQCTEMISVYNPEFELWLRL